jgi:hypothetical protein
MLLSLTGLSLSKGRLPQELLLAGCTTLEAANRFLREHYMAEFNRRFQVKPEQAGSAFVPAGKPIWTILPACNGNAR